MYSVAPQEKKRSMADRIYSHIIIIGGFLVFKDPGNYFVHQATSEDDDENNVWTINVKSEVLGKLLYKWTTVNMWRVQLCNI